MATTDGVQIEHLRGLDFFNPEEHQERHVALVGCGGVGSPTAVLLAKMGIQHLTAIDPDNIEPHNIPNQFFAHTQVDLSKVKALEALCELFGGMSVEPVQGDVRQHYDLLSDVVISGLDSMAIRKELWEKGIKKRPQVGIYMDARLAGQYVALYTINPNDNQEIEFYEKTLYTDEEAEVAPCTARGVIDVSFAVAALIGRAVRLFLQKHEYYWGVALNMETLFVSNGKKVTNEVVIGSQ